MAFCGQLPDTRGDVHSRYDVTEYGIAIPALGALGIEMRIIRHIDVKIARRASVRSSIARHADRSDLIVQSGVFCTFQRHHRERTLISMEPALDYHRMRWRLRLIVSPSCTVDRGAVQFARINASHECRRRFWCVSWIESNVNVAHGCYDANERGCKNKSEHAQAGSQRLYAALLRSSRTMRAFIGGCKTVAVRGARR